MPTARTETLRAFHRATEHTPTQPSRPGPFDPRIEPAKVKRYPSVTPLALPADWPEPAAPSGEVLAGQPPAGAPSAVDLAGVARLLFLANGVTRTIHLGRGHRHFRAVPSAGALYPVEVYLVCGALPGLPAGVYHHDPLARVLHPLREGDWRGALATATDTEEVARRPVSLVLTGIPWRTTWKYGPRGYRHLFWDAGVMVANVEAAAGAAGWPAGAVTGFVDEDVSRLLDLGEHQPFAEVALTVLPVGPDGETAAAAAVPDRAGLPVDPLSSQLVEEPELTEIHAAGALADAGAVAGWRGALAGLDGLPPAGPAQVAEPEAETPTVDEVVLRRGSTRRFDAERPAPTAALTWGLAVAGRELPVTPVPAGRTPLTTFVAVHAVDGVDSGGYRWTPEGLAGPPVLLDRRDTAHLCLDQPLGGTSAFTTFFCADLETLADAGGVRSYRLAQLAGGVASGRLQLAAFALGLGGTGLTFYDAEVRDLFGTAADPMLVTAVGWPDYRAAPGRRPGEGA